MRLRFVPALLSLALLGCIGRELGAQGRGQDTRPGIAVLPFDNSGSYGQDKENFDALQKGIAGMLISELAANPAARVVEREEIEKLLAEQSLGASGKVTPETAAKIGRSEEHTSELQSLAYLVCRLLLEKKKQAREQYHVCLHAAVD